ncbi:extracellular solute-binding protein [Acholeplasma hippikon]|uniref:Bacterial extracellular solute-binding protein n=1 Tax=Acholeplasma hippikon TaxID=264636 RepID=A0A449BK35_9MOLU|nr:extracellular solute-binding protein [Acholeplasma hippikon]VEU82814.1 Bacterial extracellular solute-binding protein [Acholeplasma hippikon]
MKKIYGLLIFAAMLFVLVACGGGNTAVFSGVSDVTINVGDTFDPKAGVTAKDKATNEDLTANITIEGAVNTNVANTYTLTYKVVGSDGKTTSATRKVTVKAGGSTTATEIVIMHGAPNEIDPFDPSYTGKQQKERQDLQRKVEQELNVKVVYKPYPSNAAWGPSRVSAIVNASVSGTPLADIYWTTSDWTQQLAKGNAIVPLDKYFEKGLGENITEEAKQIGSYNGKVYAMMTGKPTVDVGLYYNMDLIEDLGIKNPTEMYLEGNWTWSKFEAWAEQAQAALASKGDGYSALGGVVGVWAQNMVPLNGGSLINTVTNRVAFHQQAALDTYDFLSKLYVDKGVFEQNGSYDSGSAAWTSGNVLIHPGSFWFLNAENRWKGLNFNLGFVPYPSSDTYKGGYVSRVSGLAVFNIAAGLSETKEELAFRVWNALQLWQTDEEFRDEFELTLISRLNDEKSVEAYLAIYDKTQLDLLNALGISQYDTATGWMARINTGIKTKSSRTAMDEIKPIYEAALEAYLSGK